jgi:hypothetical protein
MDLGATICRPEEARLPRLPARRRLPRLRQRRRPKPSPAPKVKRERPHRHGVAWWIERDGAVWLVRRPAKGMLGGMAALPGPEWSDEPPRRAAPALRHGPPRLHPFHARPAPRRARRARRRRLVAAARPDRRGGAADALPPRRRGHARPGERSLPCRLTLFSGPGLDRADALRATRAHRRAAARPDARQLEWDNGAPALDEDGRCGGAPVTASRPCSSGSTARCAALLALPAGNVPIDSRAHFPARPARRRRRADLRRRAEPRQLAPPPRLFARSAGSRPRPIAAAGRGLRRLRRRTLSARRPGRDHARRA